MQCSFLSSLEINLTEFFKLCSKYSGSLHSREDRESSSIFGAVVGIAGTIEMWSYIGDARSQITVNLVTVNSESILSTSNSKSSKIRWIRYLLEATIYEFLSFSQNCYRILYLWFLFQNNSSFRSHIFQEKKNNGCFYPIDAREPHFFKVNNNDMCWCVPVQDLRKKIERKCQITSVFFNGSFSLQDTADFSLVLESSFSYFSLFPCNNLIIKLSVNKNHYFERVPWLIMPHQKMNN